MKKYSRRERKIASIAKQEGYLKGYQQGLHDGNPFILLAESVTKAISAMSDILTEPAFIEACKEAQEEQKRIDNCVSCDHFGDCKGCIEKNADLPTLEEAERNQIKKYFKGKCPYTDKKCEDWKCQDCEVEAAERKYMENDSEK